MFISVTGVTLCQPRPRMVPPAALAACPTSLAAPVIPADVSGKVLIGPLLSHVCSRNQSLWLQVPFSHWPNLSHMFTLSSQGMKGRDHWGRNCTGRSTEGSPGGC